MRIFAEQHLDAVLEQQRHKLRGEVTSADRNYLLNTNETQYIEYLVGKYRVEPLVIDFNGRTISDREEMIPAERFPNAFEWNISRGERYRKQVITHHLPFTGSADLLRCQPSSRIVWSTDVQVDRSSVSFDVVNFRDDAERMKRDADEIVDSIRTQAENVSREVSQYNGSLTAVAEEAVRARKAALLKQANLIASLGVPFKKADQVPSTFAVPVVQKVLAILKPTASVGPFAPEPTLPPEVYVQILQVIHDAGVAMERLPSIYSDKDEETLRDHFLMVLAPHFQSATGESFNKKGKTDILIRHEKHNLFVGECKFWKGIKGFFGTIDQLLNYLTWRDSKAAVMCFVKNKDLTTILETIESETSKHSCFVKFHGKRKDGWLQYEFHLPGDAGRAMQLAILVFHFP